VAFGNSHKAYFPNQVPANPENITTIRRALRSLDADMGGTEMESALRATVALSGPPIPQDILLITDGQIWQSEELLAMIKKANHRVFAVGVGSAVSETFIRQLAMETGGACEFVVPNEDMAEKITRHFRRIFLPRATAASVFWPDQPRETIPKDLGSIFAGDTVHAFARYSDMPTGPVRLELTLADGNISTHSAILTGKALPNTPTTMMNSAGGDLARLAAAWAIEGADAETVRHLAITYQLISPFTNFLVVDQRPEEQKSRELPLLRKTPQMLAAGWGGTGTVTLHQDIRFSVSAPTATVDEPGIMYCPSAAQRDTGIRFSMGLSQEEIDERRQRTSPSAFMFKCDLHNGRNTTWWKAELQLSSYADLLSCDLPDRILDTLTSLLEQIDPPPSEAQVVLAFLLVLNETIEGSNFSRTTVRSLNKARKKLNSSQQLVDHIKAAFPNISREEWGVSISTLDELEFEWEDE
jgi:Ca-activated chloride channel family protein